jgi:corrinoid protein of di/trimethylamine methyltransferase
MESAVLEGLKKAVMDYDSQAAAMWARKAIEEQIDPVRALDALTAAIREVGEGFARQELWLPELIGAARAMQEAMPILQAEFDRRSLKRHTLGKVVIGAVAGDIHDIGKAMVCSMLRASGFEVYDLGVNVGVDKFVEAVKEHDADILAMSALLTTTAPEMRKVIETLRREGLRERVKVMVGGGAITQAFADQIGADGYDPTAVGAARLARRLLGK